MSNLIKDSCKLMGMHKVTTTAYHLQTDGLVEQFNQTLTDVLAKTVDKSGRDWDRHLPHMPIAYQVSPQESTQEYPFFLLYGRDAQLSTEASPTQPTQPTQPKTRYQVDLDDYKTELVGSLSQACVHKSRKPSRSRSIMTYMQKSPSFIKEIVYLCTCPLRRKRRGRYTSIPIHFMALPCTIYSSGVYDLYAGVQFNVFTVVKPRLKVQHPVGIK